MVFKVNACAILRGSGQSFQTQTLSDPGLLLSAGFSSSLLLSQEAGYWSNGPPSPRSREK